MTCEGKMERIKVKCPYCGNKMEIDPKVIAFRCSKCSNKIDLDDEPIKNTREPWPEYNQYNTAHTERKIKINEGFINLVNKIHDSSRRKQEARIREIEKEKESDKAFFGCLIQTFKWIVIAVVAVLLATTILSLAGKIG